ncbi:endoplasmic reticulum aminopeptidase 2-like [Tachyglossus aculeatus]|uniref:endoplasmic reticulum aminopeptidase 2-like n=1 Tax=Tachyglossus aculeatus TaxID=9261 RepID=UPI0018F3A40D|nr:endoplasmic reticulum aminopeptidase 2-like [Tachyglossus aculeatus]
MDLKVWEYPLHEQVALVSATPLLANKEYFLSVDYKANISDGFYGFYRSTYRAKNGETRLLASTHFEPTSARMAFPCFDEPSFKANYTIRIRREAHHIALSNMPKVRTVAIGNHLLEDHFAETVKMSTYLVAFIVCDFQSISSATTSGIKVSVYTAPDKLNQANYALEVAVNMLEFYEQYFNISYPLPKQDLVAIPDFQSGAMENWGLTTYRETSLLYDPETSSASDKLWVTMVIGHELAHQWFGNLVTMEWWDDVWLNEGFARYMEFLSVDAKYPELHVNDYLLGTCFAAMGRDSLDSSRPISSRAENPTQIKEMFDTVSYEKGACILHMLRNFLTDEVFQNGIIYYLKKFSFRNAKNADLWNSLANTCTEKDFSSSSFCYSEGRRSKSIYSYPAAHLDLAEIMNTWTLQKGIPLIIVNQTGRQLSIRQERFLKTVLPEEPLWASMQAGFQWQVPLTYITSSSRKVGKFLLKTQSDAIELDSKASWVKFNVDMNGYYIVHYEGAGWDSLTQLLSDNPSRLSDKDRASLIHNAFQLVSAGKLSLHKALDLTLYLRHETSNLALRKGLGYWELFYHMMDQRNISDVTESLKRYILQEFKPVMDKQSWSDEGSVSERLLRAGLLGLACELQDPLCIQKASALFRLWMSSTAERSSIPTDVMETVYSVGAKTAEGWNFLLERYTESMSGAQQGKIRSALASSRDGTKLARLLELGLEGKVIKTQDLPSVVYGISQNPTGQRLAWSFVTRNWSKLLEKFPLGSSAFRSILVGATSTFSSHEELKEVKQFFEVMKEQASQLLATRTVLENIKKNIKWLERNLDPLKQWLARRLP